MSTIGFVPTVQQKMQQGITGGVSFRYIAEWYAGLIVEANYAQSGWREEPIDSDENVYAYGRQLNYLEIPALSHIYFGKKNFRFFVNIGPKIAFMTSENETANFSFDGKVKNPLGSYEQYGRKVEKKFDYGITGGGGFELRTKVGCFLLEGRYYFGLADIYGSNISDPFTGSTHQQISAKLTYFIQINK